MDLVLFVALSLCCWTADARYVWSDKPKILGTNEILDGETVEISCFVPVDYTGGLCRLFRGDSEYPFKVMVATSYVCIFNLTSKEVLGNYVVGSTFKLRCDYRLQEYTSISSDNMLMTVSGTRPKPSLSISRRFVSPDDIIEATCIPPVSPVAYCRFYTDVYGLDRPSCSANITFRELIRFLEPSLLLPVNLSCTYDLDEVLSIRSQYSDEHLVFVVDPRQVTSSVNCSVSVSEDQLAAFEDRTLTAFGANGTTVTIRMTQRGRNLENTCNRLQTRSDSQRTAQMKRRLQ
ncbi:uncharacterized protein LOC129376081 [Poeciliopsis prolifica]|uniref:uncharacterized protein LOC129376081 n=1 Tax=Poeciliopsis prolifica TaxID=188132 RepID=UPI0024134DD2|nr:uncharacterized protein LOC129376081 [Poeciliopsis prolifica]